MDDFMYVCKIYTREYRMHFVVTGSFHIHYQSLLEFTMESIAAKICRKKIQFNSAVLSVINHNARIYTYYSHLALAKSNIIKRF